MHFCKISYPIRTNDSTVLIVLTQREMSTLAFSSDVNGSGLHQAMIIFCFYKCVKTAQAGCKGIHLCFWIFQTTEVFPLFALYLLL